MRSQAISMSAAYAAMTSLLNGLLEAVGPCTFPRSIAQRGSLFRWPVKRFSQASGRFSIVLKRFRTSLQGGTVARHDLNLLPLSASQRTWLDLPLDRPCSECPTSDIEVWQAGQQKS